MKVLGKELTRNDWLRGLWAVPLVLAVKLASVGITERYGIMLERTISGCLPWSVYLWDKTEAVGQLERYDLVLFPAKNMQPVLADGETVGKLVAGLPGDRVTVKNGNLYINGRFLGDVRYVASKWNKPLTAWDTEYRLGKDEVFVYGTEKHSYDSRYWGPYPVSALVGRLRVLF